MRPGLETTVRRDKLVVTHAKRIEREPTPGDDHMTPPASIDLGHATPHREMGGIAAPRPIRSMNDVEPRPHGRDLALIQHDAHAVGELAAADPEGDRPGAEPRGDARIVDTLEVKRAVPGEPELHGAQVDLGPAARGDIEIVTPDDRVIARDGPPVVPFPSELNLTGELRESTDAGGRIAIGRRCCR